MCVSLVYVMEKFMEIGVAKYTLFVHVLSKVFVLLIGTFRHERTYDDEGRGK